ncbi:hypothetical protein [Novosphingobium aquae]|uniref:Uncharacterized protein n=1 Tax=Novosphingobium aquae TaxID=3133435 RepID=A0ABU8SEG7_9SPHN
MARLTFWRVMAWIGVRKCEWAAVGGAGSGGWPDKSAAVGVGVGDWNKAIILAVAPTALLALSRYSAMLSTQNAPSAFKQRQFVILQK